MKDGVYSFEKLEAWIKGKELAKSIYLVTREFPQSEQFGLTQQMRRASISVISNIAEGSGRISPKDKAHFYTMAFTSLLEVVNHLFLAHDLGFINTEKYQHIRKQAQFTSFLINALHKAVNPR